MGAWLSAYVDSLTTVSALLIALAVSLWLGQRRMLASVAALAVGTGGVAVFWDRWSNRAGDHMSLVALVHPVGLSAGDVFLLATHAPFACIGAFVLWRSGQVAVRPVQESPIRDG